MSTPITSITTTDPEKQGNSFQAAVARSATRAAALYFSRPVRLFRPSKISGWHSLRGLAIQEGSTLSPSYLRTLVQSQGFTIIPKHFIPPMLINAALGTVLWTTYAEASDFLETRAGFDSHPFLVAAVSGASAGGAQALIAAPAENIRIVFEGGSGQTWSHAWKEVFRGTSTVDKVAKEQTREQIRQVRAWTKEVGDMAGNGWAGLRWGMMKDFCGFAAFFTIFECTRRLALKTKAACQRWTKDISPDQANNALIRRHLPPLVNGLTLVGGGVVAGLTYEMICRPWDIARRTVHIYKTDPAHSGQSIVAPLLAKVKEDGLISFLRDPSTTVDHTTSTASPSKRRLYHMLRTLARVGPWGVGFLVWEAFGSELQSL